MQTYAWAIHCSIRLCPHVLQSGSNKQYNFPSRGRPTTTSATAAAQTRSINNARHGLATPLRHQCGRWIWASPPFVEVTNLLNECNITVTIKKGQSNILSFYAINSKLHDRRRKLRAMKPLSLNASYSSLQFTSLFNRLYNFYHLS